ncbi:hypothetical protein FCM35_KLT04842 [Carex littledalei]|uniref:Uncharacterized protein n=1 Tax=Carex littledalei TaxID=544730 RepID=A0A833R3W2_9POAL|nr:hypothetical protein FCM35_KLT04842 [Carex littledalei]
MATPHRPTTLTFQHATTPYWCKPNTDTGRPSRAESFRQSLQNSKERRLHLNLCVFKCGDRRHFMATNEDIAQPLFFCFLCSISRSSLSLARHFLRLSLLSISRAAQFAASLARFLSPSARHDLLRRLNHRVIFSPQCCSVHLSSEPPIHPSQLMPPDAGSESGQQSLPTEDENDDGNVKEVLEATRHNEFMKETFEHETAIENVLTLSPKTDSDIEVNEDEERFEGDELVKVQLVDMQPTKRGLKPQGKCGTILFEVAVCVRERVVDGG